MSDSPPPDRSPPGNATQYPTATEIVHSILDDRPSTATISPSGELYRYIERHNRERVRHLRRELAAARAQGSNSSMSTGSSERDLRRRFNRDPPSGSTTEDLAPTLSTSNTSLPPLRGSLSARVARRGGRFSGAQGREVERNSRLGSSSASPVLERLLDANNHLRSLLQRDDGPTTLPPRTMSSPPPLSESQDDNRRVKRRRLESDRTEEVYRGFRYGKYGQSEPGKLTMELVSCDGGLFGNGYAAENILKDDSSVYCTEGNRCNIILRHQGSTTFSLQELTIKAPDANYTSPVREGMVFVAMESDDLFNRTAQYQIPYVTATEGQRRPAVYSIRHDEDGNRMTRLPPIWATSREAGFEFDGDDDDMEPGRIAQLPAEFTTGSQPFNITTECSNEDGESGPGVGPGGRLHHSRSYARLRDPPNRIGTLPFESESSEDDGDAWAETPGWPTYDELGRGRYNRPDEEAQGGVSRSLVEAREASQLATQEAVRAVGGELMTPMVHFRFEKHKSNCTIKFDPPISGRFILLKVWNPHHNPDANIDIQGVVVKGFAGPRFSAAVEYM